MRVFERPKMLKDKVFHYCPGCTHGIVHRLVAEIIEEMEIRERTVGVCPVGCAVLAYDYLDIDMQEASHGRAPAVATGIKRVLPDRVVFTYQGDGDLAAIGMTETVHTAARGEPLTVIFINNAIYGMTNGQMAPTTLLGQRTQTTPYGRNAAKEGYPIKVCEMLATLDGPSYIARVSVGSYKSILNARKVLREAFRRQIEENAYALVEVLSTCPTNWSMKPRDAMDWIENEMQETFPVGIFKE
ncbi:MAG: thiamine pyrophosphate-dependent enzyme [bacterium]|jgi:2-oxoglutarate ferredoxin oxidoreductase subunit beta|nr:thiamine pyrophosphate-dependent enzyme [bacterium]MDD3804990.1 thiamine pyrophosphate-dependent enzyme [bacterium]MDD4152969.1 thiamine pyrophosphate-dependent enzyme [bacterium]